MKYQDKIATSKLDRTLKFVSTGARVGGNYIKHYVQKAFNPEMSDEQLHKDNAEEIYNTLSNLKGSALKIAQMLSMDKAILPQAYTDKFIKAQYSAPPLSGPLVVKTFTKSLGKSPQELFDNFDMNASNAASIGQVHTAYKNGKKLAVKIQYPGVADSIKSDLQMVKPLALTMLNVTEAELEKYMAEVEEKLLEETDYNLELKRSIEIARQCRHIEGLRFPEYYSGLSSDRILTMDWMEGMHLDEFLATNPPQETRNKIGQSLWDFYDFQIHKLKLVHADPHPGNFLFGADGTTGIIDFGCIKVIPPDFYYDYFALVIPELTQNDKLIEDVMLRMELIKTTDDKNHRNLFKETFLKTTGLLSRPFRAEEFDFGNDEYMNSIYMLGEELSNNKELREGGDARGSKHMLYVNRTFFGLYTLLNRLKAKIRTSSQNWKQEIIEHYNPAKQPV